MDKTLKRTLVWGSSGLLLLLLLIVFNQLHQVFLTTSAIHPLLGQVVTGILIILFAIVFVIPIYGFMMLKKPLSLPQEGDIEGQRVYLINLKKRLMKNKHLQDANFIFNETLEVEQQIDEALEILSQKTFVTIKEASNTVFITTAISQNGVFDSLFVLVSLSRMIWKISHIYNQRPQLKETLYLYGNVAATVLMAREIEDLALVDEQLQPIISSMIGESLSHLVPGTTAVANLVMNSVIQGSANAFLTLRVGAMTRRYCEAKKQQNKRWIRRSSTIEACGLLGSVVQDNSKAVIKAFASATKKATIDKTVGKVKQSATKTGDFVKSVFTKTQQDHTIDE